jgi:CPA2 family monovalent cation:H+ antiporter-2
MNLIALLLLAAAVALGLARLLRLPALPLLIGAGMTLNLTDLIPSQFLPANVGGEGRSGAMIIIEFGLIFIVFASGVELNPRRFARHGRTVAWVGSLQFGVSAFIGWITSRWIGFDPVESAYMGFGLAASSTLVVIRHLRVRQAMFEPYGRLVTGVLLLQDAAMIAVIVVLFRLEGGLQGVAVGLVELFLLGGAAWLAQRRIVPAVVKRAKPDEESLLLWLAGVLFAFVGIASLLGLPAIVGAFAGGFAFSAFPLNGLVRGQLSSLSDFFHSVFFVALGALVGIPAASNWILALQFSVIVVLVTPPLVAVLAEWRGLNTRASIESGLLLSQTSEFSLLLGVVGLAAGHLSTKGFEILATTTLLTMTLTPFLSRERVARALLPLHPLKKRSNSSTPPEGHVLLLGFGSAGLWTVKPLLKQGEAVLVVDDDAVVCRELERMGVPVMRGDGSETEMLDRSGASMAKLIIASMRGIGDAIEVLRYVKGVPVVVRVFEESEAEVIRNAGGIPVMYSEAAAETFLAWFSANDRIVNWESSGK